MVYMFFLLFFLFFFFFSSRRRHTRWTGDWSSDVCSSDLSRKCPPSSLSSNSSATAGGVSVMNRLRGTLLQHLGDLQQQFRLLVGLSEVSIHADVERALAVLVAAARGDHDDRHVAQPRVGLHVSGQLVAVHARHLDVQQHQVGYALVQLLQRVDTVLGGADLVLVAFQHATRDLAHGDRVVDHHHQRTYQHLLDDRRLDRAEAFGQALLAADHAVTYERRQVENDQHRTIAHDGRTEQARHRADLRADRLDHDLARTEHGVDADGRAQVARAGQQQRLLFVLGGEAGRQAEQLGQVVDAVVLVAVLERWLVGGQQCGQVFRIDSRHALYRGHRDRERGLADAHQDGLGDGEGERQAQHEGGALAFQIGRASGRERV